MHEIRNYMEVCVRDKLGPLIKEMKSCDCESCRYDVMAIALNNLPPKYVVTNKGQIYTKLSGLQVQFDVDVISEITKAIKLVSAKPRHDCKKNEG